MPVNPKLATLRELARCYQAFEAYSSAHIRSLGLTPAQFDIVATLGNTAGMSCGELGERTLITKGTLTGVLDRLEKRGLLVRRPSPTDGRSVIVQLTEAGEALFSRIFPAHVAYMDMAFDRLTVNDLENTRAGLARLRAAFENGKELK